MLNIDIPWQLTDCGTEMQLLFKEDNIVFATYHHDLMVRSLEDIIDKEKDNLLSSNFQKSY